MDESEDKNKQRNDNPRPTGREIGNANLFADDIIFSDTEKILFEDDLNNTAPGNRNGLMDGNPADRYSPNTKINQGGMKAIWEVDDHRTARKVAMALIQDSKIASEDDIDSFLYEARLTANLQHPNIIPIYDIALDENGNPYFTMKALKGETLDEIIKQLRTENTDYTKRYTPTRLLSIFLKVCNAIDYAHTKGVIHLDLKPSNINVGDFGDVHVLDWGLSTLMIHLNEHSTKRREFKNVVGGTPGYMSPEQAQGTPSDIVFQTDIYMLGAMLYEILTHQCPIIGKTVKDVLQKTVRGDFPSPAKRAPKLRIPAPLAAIVMKAMATDPAERYSNVSLLIRDLHNYQDGFATVAENPTFIRHTALLIKRHKLAVSMIGISATIIAAVLTNSFYSIKNSETIALDAFATLQEKNDYIAITAQKVAPDYLDLMAQQEKNYDFAAAEESLNTGLAFDPSLEMGWLWKGKMLLCQQKFSAAWNILSGNHGHPVLKNPPAVRLAKKYMDLGVVTDADLPQLVKDFKTYNLEDGIPRLFYHLNKSPFDPESRFPAIAESLKILNPKLKTLNFKWQQMGSNDWIINMGDNPDLDTISPLCGLNIKLLNANNIGAPNLNLLTEDNLLDLRVSGARLNHLFELDQLAGLKVLDISQTRIRNLTHIIKYPKLTTLDISGIKGLSISPQLIWNRNLKLLTVSEAFRNDPTIIALSRRGVIIIYSAN